MGNFFLGLLLFVVLMGWLAIHNGNALAVIAFLIGLKLLFLAIPIAIALAAIRWLVRDIRREWTRN
jgi:ABC-type polysaccharide/polyol phosphate export permease